MDNVLWIDDWPEAMQEMLSTFFHELWEKNIRSEIMIFGDAHVSEHHITDEVFTRKTTTLSKAIYSEFVSFLLENNADEDYLKKHYGLIMNNEYEVFKLNPHSDIMIDKRDFYLSIKDQFMEIKKDHQNIQVLGEKIYDALSLKKYKYVLIDLRITAYGNSFYNKVYHKPDCFDYDENFPLMSMILYHYILSLPAPSPKPIIYSTYTRPKNLAMEWEKNYNRIFGYEKDIEIYNRFGQGVLHDNQVRLQEILCS